MNYPNISKTSIISSIIIYIFVLVLMAYSTDAGFDKVFVGILPFLLYINLLVLLSSYGRINYLILFASAVIFPLIFLVIWSAERIEYIANMEGPQIAAFNFMLSLIPILILAALQAKERLEETHIKKRLMHHAHLSRRYAEKIDELNHKINELEKKSEITEANFRYSLRTIEDKCKAINFVIGRVYSLRNGANKEIRARVSISRDLYNVFSDVVLKFEKSQSKSLLDVVGKIVESLAKLEFEEKKLFSIREMKLLRLNRDGYGNDRIIDVLSKNDKDPVLQYHSESKEICSNIIRFLKSPSQKI